MFLLLGGDYGFEPASLEAFPQQHYGCDGRANLLCAAIEPFLLRRLPTGGITLLVLVVTIALKRVSVVFRPAMTCFKHWLVRNTPISVINQNPSVHFFLQQNCHCCFKGDSMFRSDVSHANRWVLNNISDKGRCRRILSCFSESWRYVNAHLAGMCRRRLLLNAFGDKDTLTSATGDCCDVCLQTKPIEDFKEELKILLDVLNQVGSKEELKIAEWIRGSSISWTNFFNLFCASQYMN